MLANREQEGTGAAGPHNHHQLVFVVGLHRSATTLLAELLAAHRDFGGFQGTGANMNEGQFLQSVIRGPKGEVLDSVGALGLKLRNRLTEESSFASPETAAAVWREWARHWDLSKRWLVEKSPGHLTKTRLLQRLYPGASFILITRHPIAQSMAIRKWSSNRPNLQHLVDWAVCHALFDHDARRLSRVLVVRYEDLCADPSATLSRIFQFLGAPPQDVLDRPLEDSNSKYFALWNERNRQWRFRVEATIARLGLAWLFARHGYTFDLERGGLARDFVPGPGLWSTVP